MIIQTICGNAKGEEASIFITGLLQTDSVSAVSPSGESIQAVWGAYLIEGVITQCFLISASEYGTYNITAVRGDKTTTAEVLVDVATDYVIPMTFSRLPVGYTEVASLQSNNSGAYINLNRKHSVDFTYKGKIKFHTTTTSNCVKRAYTGTGFWTGGIAIENDKWLAEGGWGTYGSVALDTEYLVELTQGNRHTKLVVNGIQVYDRTSFSGYGDCTTLDFLLFAMNANGTPTTTSCYAETIGDQEIWFGDTDETFVLVNCYRNSDGVAGFYDLTRNIFLPSLGGNLIAGEPI